MPHQRLLSKLKAYNIRGNLLAWIESFLKNRKQKVTVNGAASDWKDVVSGVPQGSVLGPILFVLYINDLPDTVKNYLKLFADDTKLFSQIDNANDCQLVQQDIDTLENWSEKWLLSFHPQKCKVMRLGKGHPAFTYQMTDREGQKINLTETECEKDLGINIDNKLKFNLHIQKTIAKANQTLGMIRRTFQYLSAKTLITLYKSRVRPIIEYGNTVWQPYLKKDITAVENIQRRATKMLPGLANLPYEERLKQLKLPSLQYRRKRGDMIETWKFLQKIYKADCPWFTLVENSSTRGHPLKLKKQRPNTIRHANIFSNRVIDAWNSLPSDIVMAPSINSFKNRLDNHWRDKQYAYED